ncbi:MAG: Maf family protein [Anaerolineae bacterium]
MPTEDVSIILASASPRRQELIAGLGLQVRVLPADIDETRLDGESPADLAERLSAAKAQALADKFPEAVVIAADTLVALGQEVLGKPVDEPEAIAMLTMLRARIHSVFSGLAILRQSAQTRSIQVVCTQVRMRDYGEEELRRYVASGDSLDKAGAYAIQSPSFSPVAAIEGCYTNVMGLPICHLHRVLTSWGIPVPRRPNEVCPLGSDCGCRRPDGPTCETGGPVHWLA